MQYCYPSQDEEEEIEGIDPATGAILHMQQVRTAPHGRRQQLKYKVS